MIATESLSSIGFVCQTLQTAPGRIKRAAEELGLRPVCCINGIDHYSDEQVSAIREHLTSKKKEQK